MIIFCHIPQRLAISRVERSFVVLQTVHTCVTLCDLTGFFVPEAMRAEVKNKVVVIRKSPKSQVYQIGKFIHWLDIGISSAEMTKERNIMSFDPPPPWKCKCLEKKSECILDENSWWLKAKG